MKASLYVFVASTLLASTQLAAAQGTSGGTGAVASIPGSVVRGHEQGFGLFSILTDTGPSNQNPGPAKRTTRPVNGEGPSKSGGK
jgi:hypothetical protein